MTLLTTRRVLLGLTLGVLLALTIAPQTRWLVQVQALSLIRLTSFAGTDSPLQGQARAASVAARYPNDYQIQYAATVWGDGGGLTQKLRALEGRFPNNVSLRANVLRYACEDIRWDRREDFLITGQPVPAPNKQGPPNDPAVLAAFDRDAAAGERLDPNNAYFPYLCAVGLYAAHRDAEAQAAILRAGTEPRWDEYAQDEAEGRWRLSALVYGPSAQEAVARTAVAAMVEFPQYAKIRAVARAVTYQAIEAEQAGDFSHGIALRHALIHCAGLMRAQSSYLIDALVGIAIVAVAMDRPGAAPRPARPFASTDAQRRQARSVRVAAYAAYLRRHGDAVGAAQATAEAQADQQVMAIISEGLDRFSVVPPLQRLLPWWATGLLLLTNAAWLLIFGAAAVLLGRFRAARESGSASGGVIWGVAAGTVTAFGILVFSALNLNTAWDALPAVVTDALFLLALVAAVLFLWRVRRSLVRGRAIGRGLGIAVLTCAGWCSLYALVQWQTAGMQSFIDALRQLTSIGGSEGMQSGPTLEHLLAPVFAMAVPLLVLLVGLFRSRRAPLRVTVAAIAPPVACLLLLAYAGVVLGTARQERIANDVLTRSFANEGRYYAAQVGQTWPGVVD